MGNALIVSSTDSSAALFVELLNGASVFQHVILQSCGEARRMLLEREFDIVIISAPLKDESGEALSVDIASKGMSQVILVVKNEFYDEVAAATENEGVLTISKPVNKLMFWAALKLAKAAQARVNRINKENKKLKKRIEDIRVVDRAKYILFSHYKMSEEEAHKYIEKQAMDMRVTRREIAENILKTYDN